MYDLTETTARHQIRERLERARSPRIATTPARHRLAARLHRIADRIDN